MKHFVVIALMLLTAQSVLATAMPLSSRLTALLPDGRADARIALELPGGSAASRIASARAIEDAWNTGDHDGALAGLRVLETSMDGATLAVGIQWRTPREARDRDDIRIGGREHVRNVGLDFADLWGLLEERLYSVLVFDLAGGGGGWSVNLSEDHGYAWQETYLWLSTETVGDASGRVGAGYLYVGYTGAGTGANTAIYARRFDLTDGSADAGYGTQLVGDLPVAVTDVAVESDADGGGDHLHCLAIRADHELLMWSTSAPGLVWQPVPLGIADAQDGLSVHWSFGPWFLYVAYRSVDDRVHVMRFAQGSPPIPTVYDLDSTTGPPAIAAVDGGVVVVYEHDYAGRRGIKAQESYNDAAWYPFDLALPTADAEYLRPQIAARFWSAFGIVYQEQGVDGDRVWFLHYGAAIIDIPDLDKDGSRDVPQQLNDGDVAVGMPLAVEAVPPAVTDVLFSFGVIWIGGDTVDQGAYFQRLDFGSPWGAEASYTCAYPGPVSVFARPDGLGEPLNACHASGGAVVDATITLTLLDWLGNPIPFYPPEDVWLETSGGGLSHCAAGTIADGPSDQGGQMRFTHPVAGGGHSEGETTIVLIAGAPVNQPGLPMTFNSPDVDGNLHVDLGDVSVFAHDYFNAYHYRCDFNWDGAINLAELSRMASAIGADCQSAPARAIGDLAVTGEVALSFASDAVLSSRQAAPGDLVQAYLLVTGPATVDGIRGLQGSLRATDNLEIVQWSFGERQVNVAQPPAFMVGWAEPQVAKAAGQPVNVLTVTLRVKDDQPAVIALDRDLASGADVGPVFCAAGDDASLGRLIATNPSLSINREVVTPAASRDAVVAGSLRNEPNPFNPSTDIAFELTRGGQVEVRIFDLAGKFVRGLATQALGAGPGSLHWDGRDQQGGNAPSGLYFGQIFVDGAPVAWPLKMSLVK